MQGSISVVKTVKTKMRDNYREDKKRNKNTYKKDRKLGKDKRKFSFDD